jgi:hypothetical protein
MCIWLKLEIQVAGLSYKPSVIALKAT